MDPRRIDDVTYSISENLPTINLRLRSGLAALVVTCGLLGAGCSSEPRQSVRLGAPLSTAYLYGWAAERAIRLAVEEINADGGVDVAGTKLPFEVDVLDTRDLEPGVPIDDAIKAVERLILQKDADFLVGGPIRSEAALAVLDLLATYKKVSILSTGVLSPAYSRAVAENYEKYKYGFRIRAMS